MCVNDHQQKHLRLGALLDVIETHCVSQQLNSELRTSTLRLGGVILAYANIHTTCNTHTPYLTLKEKTLFAFMYTWLPHLPFLSFPFQNLGFHFHYSVTGK